MFADDTHVTIQGTCARELETRLNPDLENVKEWLLANKLSINTTKTEYMLIGSKYKLANIVRSPSFHMGGYNIERVPTSKSLGVHIDENLSWSGHIDETAKKISRAINGLRQVRPFVHFHTLLAIYNALILPLFDYCDVVWDNPDKGLAERIQKLQNRAARIITQSSYDIRSHDILRQLKWEPIGQRRTKHREAAWPSG